jgi:hypothetical protein
MTYLYGDILTYLYGDIFTYLYGDIFTYLYGGIFPNMNPLTKPTESTATFTTDATAAHEAGLREGRQQALKWVADVMSKLQPFIAGGGWPAKNLIEGFAAQVQKYLRTGDLPGTGDDE